MTTLYEFSTKIFPFMVVPYCLALLVVIGYFIHRKISIMNAIKNVPAATILQINLKNVKKNLQIKSMIYNFILVLSMLELGAAAVWGLSNILIYYTPHNLKDFNISNSCTIKETNLINLQNSRTLIHRMLNTDMIILSLIPRIMYLFLIVLRRAFLDCPYRNCIKRNVVHILGRFFVILLLSSFVHTWYLSQLIFFPLGLLDFRLYIRSSYSFYLLLKGRRDEAKFHSSKRDYLDKKRIVNYFFYSQMFTVSCFALVLASSFLGFVSEPLSIFGFNPCFLSYITLDYFPTLNFHSNAFLILYYNLYIIQLSTIAFLDIIMFILYFSLCISIFLNILRRGKHFNNVNARITQPLMERYRSNLENRSRIENRRPPFIQAFRSNTFTRL